MSVAQWRTVYWDHTIYHIVQILASILTFFKMLFRKYLMISPTISTANAVSTGWVSILLRNMRTYPFVPNIGNFVCVCVCVAVLSWPPDQLMYIFLITVFGIRTVHDKPVNIERDLMVQNFAVGKLPGNSWKINDIFFTLRF